MKDQSERTEKEKKKYKRKKKNERTNELQLVLKGRANFFGS